MRTSSITLTIALVALLISLCVFEGIGSGTIRAGSYLARLWPPEVGYLPMLLPAVADTLKMSIVGSTLAAISAVPLSFFGCKGLVRSTILYTMTRFVLSVLRATPVMVLAIMFVAAVGLGPAPGILGIWFHSTGALGKFMSETLDAADRSVQEAASIDGATRWQSFVSVLLPMQANAFLSYYLYYIEANFRDAVMLGIVGAGGIGLELLAAIGMFAYRRVGLIVLTVISTALVLDFFSRWVRRRFLEGYNEFGRTKRKKATPALV